MAETSTNQEATRAAESEAFQRNLMGMVDALLKTPGTVFESLRTQSGTIRTLLIVIVLAMAVAGSVCATTGGGIQYWLVPAKFAVGIFLSALICLPSLHIFSCMSGLTQDARTTAVSLLMGVGLTSLLLVGFAPIAWIFSQATSSPVALGTLNIAFLFISACFGLRLVHRALASVGLGNGGGLVIWSILFVLVLFQMTTTLRPLVGPFDGHWFQPRMFFLEHWFSAGGTTSRAAQSMM